MISFLGNQKNKEMLCFPVVQMFFKNLFSSGYIRVRGFPQETDRYASPFSSTCRRSLGSLQCYGHLLASQVSLSGPQVSLKGARLTDEYYSLQYFCFCWPYLPQYANISNSWEQSACKPLPSDWHCVKDEDLEDDADPEEDRNDAVCWRLCLWRPLMTWENSEVCVYVKDPRYACGMFLTV